MHELRVMDVVPPNLGALRAALKELPQAATLVYRKQLDTEPNVAWQGKLVDLPDGVYELWQEHGYGFYLAQLMKGHGKLLLNGRLLWAVTQGTRRLTDGQLKMFRELLDRSEKVLHVYEEPETGTRQFTLIWPNEEVPVHHPEAQHCLYVGRANLQTGEIE